MSDNTKIEWTEATWNPVTGCTQISPGCANCYAMRFANRFKGVPGHPYELGFELQLREERLLQPLEWKRPRRIFVNSMSDLFHEGVPDTYIRQVFEVMAEAEQHTFQVLTKRPERAKQLAPELPWPENIWFGVSVENSYWTRRIDALRDVPAAIRFLSCEPLLGPARRAEPVRHPLGDLRRRERRRRKTAKARVVPIDPRPMRHGGSTLLLQAMGRVQQPRRTRRQEEGRP